MAWPTLASNHVFDDGHEDFRKEIVMILRRMERSPPKGAAMLRNRVAARQHRQHWIEALTRIMDGTIGESPDGAYDLTEAWLTKRSGPGCSMAHAGGWGGLAPT